MHNFRELNIWKDSMVLTKSVYKLTKAFPSSELYGLTSQINRSAVSIPSNIAEGAGRGGNKEFIRFLFISLGSSFELETQLLLANEFGYLTKNDLDPLQNSLTKIQKMINSLISTLKK